MAGAEDSMASEHLGKRSLLIEGLFEYPLDWPSLVRERFHREVLAAYERPIGPQGRLSPLAFPRVVDAMLDAWGGETLSLEVRPPVSPLPYSVWFSGETANRFLDCLATAPEGGEVFVISGSLRHELFNQEGVVVALRKLAASGIKVTVIAGPVLTASRGGENKTFAMIREGNPNYVFYYARDRWDTHGCFVARGRGYVELPHTEVDDIRRPMLLRWTDPVVRIIQTTIEEESSKERLVLVDRGRFAEFSRQLRSPMELWEEFLASFSSRTGAGKEDPRRNYEYMKALTKEALLKREALEQAAR